MCIEQCRVIGSDYRNGQHSSVVEIYDVSVEQVEQVDIFLVEQQVDTLSAAQVDTLLRSVEQVDTSN